MKNYSIIVWPEDSNLGWTTEYETPSFTYKHVTLISFLALAIIGLWH